MFLVLQFEGFYFVRKKHSFPFDSWRREYVCEQWRIPKVQRLATTPQKKRMIQETSDGNTILLYVSIDSKQGDNGRGIHNKREENTGNERSTETTMMKSPSSLTLYRFLRQCCCWECPTCILIHDGRVAKDSGIVGSHLGTTSRPMILALCAYQRHHTNQNYRCPKSTFLRSTGSYVGSAAYEHPNLRNVTTAAMIPFDSCVDSHELVVGRWSTLSSSSA